MSKFNLKFAEFVYNESFETMQDKIAKCYPTDNKTLVIIGGQPASGKSSITQKIEDLHSRNIVSLNGDDYKTHYPKYKALLKADPDKTSEIVQPYSNYAVDELKKELIHRSLNVMVEGTMRNPQTPLKTVAEFAPHGYKVEAYIVAANYYASRVGIVERCERDRLANDAGRSVKIESHDEAYHNIPDTIKELVNSKQFAKIIISDRNGNSIAELANGDDVVAKYIEYRNRITPELKEQIDKSIDNTIQMKQNRNAPIHEINELLEVRKNLSKEFNLQQSNEIELKANCT